MVSNERPKILFSPFFLAPTATYPQDPRACATGQSQAARAEAEAAFPGEYSSHASPRVSLPRIPLLHISVLASCGGAAATEGHGTVNALDMDGSSCGFDRARSRPAKAIKDAKKAAVYFTSRY